MKPVAIAFLLLVLIPPSAFTQAGGGQPFHLGIVPGAAMRWQSGGLRTCGEADCLPFTEGSGMGFMLGLRAMHPLGDALYLRGSIGWESVHGDFSTTRRHYPILGMGGTLEYADLEDELDVTLSMLSVDLGIAYRILDPGVYVTAAPVLSMPLSAQWKQTESIAAPSGLRYLDGSVSKVLLDGDIPGTRAFVSLRLGTGALFAVGETLTFAPELGYVFPLTELQTDFGWSMSGIDFSIAVMWSF